MQDTQTYRRPKGASMLSDAETWIGNALAVLLTGLAIGSGAVGVMVAFGYIETTINDPFQNGIIWLLGGVVLAVSATVFRREHHIVDDPTIVESQVISRPPRPSDYR